MPEYELNGHPRIIRGPTAETLDLYYSRMYEYISGVWKPKRLMAIEAGGVVVVERLAEYLRDRDVEDFGIFSVDVSRKERRIKDRADLHKELKKYPGFLKDCTLIAVDDISLDGITKGVVDMEVGRYFRPKCEIADYVFTAVISGTNARGRPLAGIYGALMEDRGYGHIHARRSLHIKPRFTEDKKERQRYRRPPEPIVYVNPEHARAAADTDTSHMVIEGVVEGD